MGKKKGKGKGTPKAVARRAQPRQVASHHGARRSQLQEAPAAGPRHFSLRDEARHMSNHRSPAFDSSKKLRHMPVAFVSAGRLEGTVKEKPPQTEPGPLLSPSSSPSPAATAALAHMTIRSPSPALSVASASSGASSEELIVFRGRGHTPLNQDEPAPLPTKADTAPSVGTLTIKTKSQPGSSITEATTSLNAEASLAPDPVAARGTSSADIPLSHSHSDIGSDTNSLVDSQFEKRRSGRARWEGKTTEWVSRSKPGVGWLPIKQRPNMDAFVNGDVDPRDAAMDDYAQNAEAFGLTSDMLSFAAGRELDLDMGSHNDWESKEEPEIPTEQDEDDGWASDQARDLDALSTSDDVEGIIVRITGRRTRTYGVQYQVVYEGCTRDDARWLPIAFLNTPSDKVLIEAYEAKQQKLSSSSNSTSEFSIDGESSEEDDELDDRQLAQALQRQEELGIDNDDLVLYGADESGLVSTSSRTSRTIFDRPNQRRQQQTRGGRLFPSASAMADALDMDSYGGFDIMDTERPSLRPKKKGRRGQMPPELDDSDLNEQLQASWEADRRRKRLKKAEREELRKQGLLGRKDRTPDLRVKYKDGFVMDDVLEEIRDFWATDVGTLSLPAMEAHRRAVIHQFVGEFGIKSKSQGDGVKRHTVLHKTVHTLRFDDNLFDRILTQKKYTRRLHAMSNYPAQKKKEKTTRTNPTVSYKDGEIVGAKAPELGVENKGRSMLEKMGWSKGMALGAIDNKGILQPITHTVKITKAGLR